MTPGSEMSVEKYASERPRDGATRIDALQMQPVEIARIVLEVPPRDAVLRADDSGLGPDERRELRCERRERVGLHAEDEDVWAAHVLQVSCDLRPDFEVAVRAEDPQALLLHRAQVRSTREQHHVGARLREARADEPADRAGPCDRDSHKDWA